MNFSELGLSDIKTLEIIINGEAVKLDPPKTFNSNYYSGLGSILCGLRKATQDQVQFNNDTALFHEGH